MRVKIPPIGGLCNDHTFFSVVLCAFSVELCVQFFFIEQEPKQDTESAEEAQRTTEGEISDGDPNTATAGVRSG